MTPRTLLGMGLAVAALTAADGCSRPPHPAGPPGSSVAFAPAFEVPMGADAGGAPSGPQVANPLAGDATAAARGKALFAQMNCAGCHGYSLGGAMGPNLTDRYWRYGGTPGAIYQSIANGRPQGMPAWGRALPPTDIWSLVSYIQSYGGTTAPAEGQAAKEGDVAALPVTPTNGAAPPKAAAPSAAKRAHP